MTTTHYAALGETLVQETMDNGLRVNIVPRPAFHETFAQLAVDYGSVDTHYRDITGAAASDPAGIAHFLEHKLFEKEDHDAFDLFGATGADANAFTSTNRTAYLFSTPRAVKKNLATLLDFVQSPYFSAKTVAKEKGIIGQEIQMYQDDPGWLLYNGLLNQLYPGEPIAQDVTGTLASIADITPELLYRAYDTFYQPSNCTLTVVGPVDPAEILALVAENQAAKPQFAQELPQRLDAFQVAPVAPAHTLRAAVVRPKWVLGVRGQTPLANDLAGTRFQIATQLLLEMLFGDSGAWFQQAYDQGLLDDSFDYDYSVQRPANYLTIGGDTSDPAGLAQAVQAVIAAGADQAQLTPERFARIKQAAIGKYAMGLNAVESVASQISAQSFSPVNWFEYGQLLQDTTLAAVQAAAARWFDPAACTTLTVLPEEAAHA